jgi:hypothetical protein
MTSAFRRGLIACAMTLLACLSSSWASCGSATCPLDTRSSFVSEKGLVRLGYEFEYLDQDRPRIGSRKASVGEIRGHHDEERTINRVHRFLGTYGVTDRLSVDMALPLVSRSHRHVHNHHGGAEIIPEDWDFWGVGDFSLQGRYAFFKPANESRPTLFGFAGVEFPTGKSHVENATGGEAEPGITPGSASYDFNVGGASLQHFSVPTVGGTFAAMPLFLSVNYKMNGKGHDDYRIGNMLFVNLGTTYPVVKWLGIMSQLNLIVREKDDRGATFEEVEKTGGEFLFFSPGLQFRLAEAWEWSWLVQIPIRQRVNEIQLTSDYNVLSSVNYRFRMGG